MCIVGVNKFFSGGYMDLEDAVAILKDEVRSKCSAYADRALAEILPLVEEKFTSTNKQETPLTCSECAAEFYSHHKYCWGCGKELFTL
jgi:hypothetical protein